MDMLVPVDGRTLCHFPDVDSDPERRPRTSATIARGGFTDHHLWVTPYRAEQRNAAGDNPDQSHGGDGLPAWARARVDRPSENHDIVVCVTIVVPVMEWWAALDSNQ